MNDNMRQFFLALREKLLGRIKARLVFLHLPKCAGQALDASIQQHYHRSSVMHINSRASFQTAVQRGQLHEGTAGQFDEVLRFREELLVYFMNHQFPYISGHMSFNPVLYQPFLRQYGFLTLLRNPVDRWISQYFFDRHKGHSEHFRITEELEPFLRSERGRMMGQIYVRMLGGLKVDGGYDTEAAIRRAQEHLHAFELVGCLEELDDFLQRFEQHFDVRLRLRRKNRNPKSQADIRKRISPEIHVAIEELCRPDMEVYRYALDTFVKCRERRP